MQLEGAEVKAKTSGILTPPAINLQQGGGVANVEPGARLTRGQPIFAIADTNTFVVSAKIDEVDINQLRAGQAVAIASDAIPGETFQGKIVSVSAQAGLGEGGARVAMFDARAEFRPTSDSQRQAIRIGMSATMTIEVYSNPAAIIVPIGAIANSCGKATVNVLEGSTGQIHAAPVTLGPASESGIEVKAGLEHGDRLVIPPTS